MRTDPQFAKTMVIAGSLAVFAAGIAREAFMLEIGPATILQDLRQFDLDAENSVPAWWGSIMLFCASLLLYVLGARAWHADDVRWRLWTVMSAVFLCLSIDEAASFHEGTITPLREAFGFSGALFYAWVVPAFLCVAALAIMLAPLLRLLPRSLLVRFVIAGVVFVSGALGMEMVGGWLDSTGLRGAPVYALAIVMEEGMEIFGLTLFLAALLDQFDPQHARASTFGKRIVEPPHRAGVGAWPPQAAE